MDDLGVPLFSETSIWKGNVARSLGDESPNHGYENHWLTGDDPPSTSLKWGHYHLITPKKSPKITGFHLGLVITPKAVESLKITGDFQGRPCSNKVYTEKNMKTDALMRL